MSLGWVGRGAVRGFVVDSGERHPDREATARRRRMSMGIFDFLKSDKKKAHEAADTAKGQVEEKGAAPPAVAAGPGSAMGGKYVDAAEATKAAAERMAA
ncbi:hypothetical protein SSAG_06705, partial [Streptomyces sp. Mg1]